MTKNALKLLLLASTLSFARITFAAGETGDEAGVHQLQTQQQEAWNRHDAKAYAALFAEDADCVNVVGWWWEGRAEIESKLTAAYAFVFRESALTLGEVKVRFLNAELAVVHGAGP